MEKFETLLAELFANKESAIAKDLKLNFKKYFLDSSLSGGEAALIVHSLAKPLHLAATQTLTREVLITNEYTEEQIIEAEEISGLMGMLNTYYKFKNYSANSQNYLSAGLRMNAFGKHSLTNKDFELLSLAHSLINACEYCIKAHEQVLLKQDISVEKIHDVARLTSILKGISLFTE